MNYLSDMIWIESRKAIRSRMPLFTALGSLLMPLGIAFLIFISKNPALSQKLGLIGAKANLTAYAATNWATYLGLFAMLMAAGGFFLFCLITSWVFGREFADGTLKDLLAVPIQRFSILLAKFIVADVWSIALTVIILIIGLVTGMTLNLQGPTQTILQGSTVMVLTAFLTIIVVMPFALFASAGRGYLLPMGMAILTLMMANLVVILGWGEYFPWAVPGLYAQAKDSLAPTSYGIVFLTGLTGVIGTSLWWAFADQNR